MWNLFPGLEKDIAALLMSQNAAAAFVPLLISCSLTTFIPVINPLPLCQVCCVFLSYHSGREKKVWETFLCWVTKLYRVIIGPICTSMALCNYCNFMTYFFKKQEFCICKCGGAFQEDIIINLLPTFTSKFSESIKKQSLSSPLACSYARTRRRPTALLSHCTT